MRRSSNLPEDVNERAFEVVQQSTQEEEQPSERSPVSQYLSEIGRRGGLKGGKARAKKLSKKRLREIGKKAANARWAKRKKTS